MRRAFQTRDRDDSVLDWPSFGLANRLTLIGQRKTSQLHEVVSGDIERGLELVLYRQYPLYISCFLDDALISQMILILMPQAVFELPGGWGVESPYLILPTPLPLEKIRPRGGRVSTPHLSFAEVGMLLDSHFLLMQFLKYLRCDDLNVTILIHFED